MRLALCMVFCCFLAGCVSRQQCPSSVPGMQGWQASNKVFTLRHGGVLKLGRQTIQLTGIIRLSTRTSSADVAIFSPFGFKLAVLRVTPDSTEVRQVSPMAKSIPHFTDQAGTVVRTLFLNAGNTSECAVIRYEGSREIGAYVFPETTTFTEPRKDYTIILRLKNGEAHDQAH